MIDQSHEQIAARAAAVCGVGAYSVPTNCKSGRRCSMRCMYRIAFNCPQLPTSVAFCGIGNVKISSHCLYTRSNVLQSALRK